MNKGLLLAVALGGAAVAQEAIAAPTTLQGKRITEPKANIGWEKPDNTPGVIRSEIDRTRTKLELAVTPGTTAKATFACPNPEMFTGWRAIANNAAETAIACDAGRCDIEIATPNFNGDTQTVSVKCVEGAKGADGKYGGESDLLTATVRTETPGNYAAPVVVTESAPTPAIPPLPTLFDKNPIIVRGGITIGEDRADPTVGLDVTLAGNRAQDVRVTAGGAYTESHSKKVIRLTGAGGEFRDFPVTAETRCAGVRGAVEYDFASGEDVRATVDLGLGAEYCDTFNTGQEFKDRKIDINSDPDGFSIVPDAGLAIGARRLQIRAAVRRAILATAKGNKQEDFVPSVALKVTF